MMNRRLFMTRGGAALLGASTTCFALSGDNPDSREALPDGSASRGMVTVRTDTAIDEGLAYLYKSRDPQLGYGTNLRLRKGHVAVTSLVGLAYMAAGNQPNRGFYGRAVTECVRAILDTTNGTSPAGFLNNPDSFQQGPMYGHGFGTLFLSEVSGMIHDHDLRKRVNDKLHLAVKVILGSQNREGGWRYDPFPREADLSVTVCQMMALRAARNSGIEVPSIVVKNCVEYVKKCQLMPDGYFRYQAPVLVGTNTSESFARTAAGVSALNSAGIYLKDKDGAIVPAVAKGLEFMLKNRPGSLPNSVSMRARQERMHYFYGHYYAVQAMWTAGGNYWSEWYPRIRDELLACRQDDGSWDDGIDSHYATAMACIILQVPNNYLPILQK